MAQDPKTIETINAYREIINNVVESMKPMWEAKVGDIRNLEKMRRLWEYHALKCFGIPGMVEPESFVTPTNANGGNQMGVDDFFQSLGFGAPKEETVEEDKEDSSDDDGFSDAEGSDDDKKGNEEEDNNGKESEDSEEEEEEEEEDDSEVLALTTPIEGDDTLICHYTNDKLKQSKQVQCLDISHIHIRVNGIPFFIKEGTLESRNNKTAKQKK